MRSAVQSQLALAIGLPIVLVAGLLGGTSVPGWTTIVVMLAFFNGVTMVMLAMLGEYVVRIINQLNMADPYFVRRVVRHDG